MSGRSAERGARPGSSPAAARAGTGRFRRYAFEHSTDGTSDLWRIMLFGIIVYRLQLSVRAVNNQLGLSYFELETVSTRANS
jgi:hypothetical protein